MSSDRPPGPPSDPPPSSGYTFGPFAPGPAGPGGPQYPYAPQPAPQPPPPRRRSLAVLLGVLGLVLVLVVVGAVFAWRGITGLANQPPTVASPSAPTSSDPTSSDQPSPDPTSAPTSNPPSPSAPPTSAPPQPGGLASDAVRGYLAALAAGNAEGALRYAAQPVPRDATLSNAVLAESRRRAPMTRITVPPVTDPIVESVRASYWLGRTPVNAVFDVVKVNGSWRLATVVNELNLDLVRQRSVPMRINGAPVTSNRVRVLPGSYAFTGNRYLGYGSRNVLLVRTPSDLVNVYGLRVGLTPAGTKKVKSVAQVSYRACLRSRSPRPANCPFRWTNPTYRFLSGTVRWQQRGSDPFRRARVSFNPQRGGEVVINIKVRLSGNCRFDGQRGTCRGEVNGTGVGKLNLNRSPLKFDWL
jgi:hypothetical protein